MKRFVVSLLTVAFSCTLAFSTIGCGGSTPPKTTPTTPAAAKPGDAAKDPAKDAPKAPDKK